MMPTWRIILLSLAFHGIVGLAMWVAVAYHPDGEKQGGNNYKRLSGTVAEGFVYRVGREKHPRATCSACRVGKMKLGLISLGAFNTIEFDDLVINIPEAGEKTESNKQVKSDVPITQKPKAETDAVVETLNLKPVMSMAHAEAKKFSGIKITNFQINQMSGEKLLPVIKAASLKNSGKRLVFHNATLYKGGEKLDLKEVELIAKPRFKLVWATGSWDLTETLSPIL